MRCIFEWNPGKWPYVKRCETTAIEGKVVCAEHDKCFCCGTKPTVGLSDSHRLAEFCDDCVLNRCDAFPGTCWNKE